MVLQDAEYHFPEAHAQGYYFPEAHAQDYYVPEAHAQDYYSTNGYGHKEDHYDNGICQNGSSIQMLRPYISSTPESTEHYEVVKENYGYEDQNDGYSDGTHHYGNAHEGFYGHEHSKPSYQVATSTVDHDSYYEERFLGLRRNRYKRMPNKLRQGAPPTSTVEYDSYHQATSYNRCQPTRMPNQIYRWPAEGPAYGVFKRI